MNAIAGAILAVGLSAVGIVGMYFHVDGAGWALAVGLLQALCL